MADFLDQMAAHSHARAESLALGELLARCADQPPPPAIRRDDAFDLIAEVKFTSPSEGALATGTPDEAVERATQYVEAGACAVSVLTEPSRFGGHLGYLEAVSAAGLPAMRKDFLVVPAQIAEARLAGAAGVLLIARMLDDARLSEMLALAADLDLFVLLECFGPVDITRSGDHLARHPALEAWVGVNTRDLATLSVDPSRLADLVGQLPTTHSRVAESGLHTPEDAARVAGQGYDMALVGTALMRAEDPAMRVRDMLSAGRAAR